VDLVKSWLRQDSGTAKGKEWARDRKEKRNGGAGALGPAGWQRREGAEPSTESRFCGPMVERLGRKRLGFYVWGPASLNAESLSVVNTAACCSFRHPQTTDIASDVASEIGLSQNVLSSSARATYNHRGRT